MFADLRDRVADRLIFRFGTAIQVLLAVIIEKRGAECQSSSERSAAHRGSVSSTRQSHCVSLRSAPQLGQIPAQSSVHSGASGSSSRSGVPDEGREIEGVVVERVGLAFERRGLVQLVDVDGDVPRDRLQAPAADRLPRRLHLTPHDDAVGDVLEGARDPHRRVGRDRRHPVAELGERRLDREIPRRAGPPEQVGDVEAERMRGGHVGQDRRTRRSGGQAGGGPGRAERGPFGGMASGFYQVRAPDPSARGPAQDSSWSKKPPVSSPTSGSIVSAGTFTCSRSRPFCTCCIVRSSTTSNAASFRST